MISFDTFSPRDGIPIYLQIIMHVKQGVASGTVQSGDELPSRRVLSTLLGVNPNTVQKAYKLLEDEGLILSHPGAGSTIIIDEQRKQAIRAELTAAEIRQTIRSLRSLGLDKAAALSLIDKNWEESE